MDRRPPHERRGSGGIARLPREAQAHLARTLTTRLSLAAALLLTAHGIGNVRFGTPKAKAVAALTHDFGTPTAAGSNTGCTPRYTEVAWGDLVAEFRSSVFSGYRYRTAGWPLNRARPPASVSPRLATSKDITLGSTVADLRAAYGALRFVGTDRWGAAGLVFYDGGRPLDAVRLRRIVEIKVGTCGDF